MIIRKKLQVQKSFRIDADMEKDLGILSQLTERSQNDLVNVAIKELLQDNKYYFLDISVLEHFEIEMENDKLTLEPFEMGGLRVEVSYSDNGGVKVRSIISNNTEILEDYTREFESIISNEFREYLINLSKNIDIKSEDIEEYLNSRLDYRDYIKKRNK